MTTKNWFDLLFDEPALRSLVAHYDAQMSKVLASAAPGASLPIEVYGVSAALTLPPPIA